MKKFLSMFMSIVMLLSITAGMNITANAEDNGAKTIASATLAPVKPYEIYEGAYGGYDDEGDGYYFAPDFNSGDKLYVEFDDKSTNVYIYDSISSVFINGDDSLFVSSYSFYFDGLGEVTVLYNIDSGFDFNFTGTVTIVENPVASFEFKPAKPYEIMENTRGHYDEEENSWFYYSPEIEYGEQLTVKYTNGSTDVFTYDEERYFCNDRGDRVRVKPSGFLFNGTGETTFIVSLPDYGKSIDVPVTIIENPVESFTLTPAKPYEIIENTHCEDEWYYAPGPFEGDKITVKYTDGSTDTFVCDGYGFYNINGDYLNVIENGFTFTGLGETTFVVELEDYGKSIDVPVTIIENPVESFTFMPIKPYEIMENTNGWYDEDEDWCYYLEDFNYGDKIIVNYKNGNKDTFEYKGFTGNYVFFNEKNDGLNVYKYSFYYDGVGETSFKVELEDYYKSIYVPVTITKKPASNPGGGSIGGGGGGGFVPAPTPEEPATEPTTEPTTKPENNTNNTTTTTTTKKPSTVTITKPQSKKKSVVVTWKAENNVSGYEVQIAIDKKFKKNKKSVKINKKKSSKKTFKKLKSNKKYYVRVRSYKIVNGKKVYGKWSKVKSVKTK